MDQAVNGGNGHGLVREHLVPRRERYVGRDSDALALVVLSDQLEEHGRFQPGRAGRNSGHPGSAGRSDRAWRAR